MLSTRDSAPGIDQSKRIDADTHLNTPVLFANTPHEYIAESMGAPESSNVMGSKGNRIVFSCTWNENRKNDIDDVRRT